MLAVQEVSIGGVDPSKPQVVKNKCYLEEIIDFSFSKLIEGIRDPNIPTDKRVVYALVLSEKAKELDPIQLRSCINESEIQALSNLQIANNVINEDTSSNRERHAMIKSFVANFLGIYHDRNFN
ncbi:MAG: hypothetical protein HYY52_06375 [Candidatus Melainabacteria bacterium]|nr:hypothetical protein [Candidatus Melainabacteria bacterium]